MRYSLIVWLIAAIIFVSTGVCEETNPDWGGSIGLSSWFPEWSNEQSDFESSTSGLFGPALFLHYRNLGVGFQYFDGTFNLQFPGSSNEITADRTDFDIMLSYRFARIFQLSALYKSIDYDWKQTFGVESTITGFGFGGGINHVFPNRLLLFGFGFYLPDLEYEQSISHGSEITGDADGFWLESGIGYAIPLPRLLAKISYRYQVININSSSMDWKEQTDGIRADISYYF